jgi:hypothetical protein
MRQVVLACRSRLACGGRLCSGLLWGLWASGV